MKLWQPNLTFWSVIFIILMIATSCIKKSAYENYVKLPDNQWDMHQRLSYDIPVDDTLSSYNVFINLRNTDDYPFQNLFLFVETFNPQGKSIRDTFQCFLADESGKWIGKGLGSHKQSQFKFKSNVRFPRSGTYTIVIEQAMRQPLLKGVSDVGVRLEKLQ